MNKFRFTLNMLAAGIFMIALATMAQAQATRTWVSGVGDDANPCSRTAPCKTFAGAISKTATGGEIDALDSAGFGAVTITKSITIDGARGFIGGILSAGTTGVIVNATSTSTVVLRNLSINGAGTGVFGVRALAVGTLSIENCVISGLTNHGIQMNLANGASGNLFVKDTFIRTGNNTVSRGINIEPVSGSASVIAVIDNVRMEKMFIGFFGGAGAISTVRNSVIYGMASAAIATQATSNAQTNIENCVLNHNAFGVQAGTGAATITRVSNSMVINNSGKGFFVTGGTLVSFGNNTVTGNGADDPPTTTEPQI
jgi:hypothetical protein